MQKADDVRRLLSVLQEYTTFGHWLPADLARITVRTLEGLLEERDAAVNDINEMAQSITEVVCEFCRGFSGDCDNCEGYYGNRGFEWRGVQKEY